MRMYKQKIKECDHAFESRYVDLSEKENYLILPSKFLNYTQETKLRKGKRIVKIIYTIDKRALKNPLVRLKEGHTPVDYFCVVYPSGRVEQWHIRKALFRRIFNLTLEENEEKLCLYLASPERVTVELFESSINEEKNESEDKHE